LEHLPLVPPDEPRAVDDEGVVVQHFAVLDDVLVVARAAVDVEGLAAEAVVRVREPAQRDRRVLRPAGLLAGEVLVEGFLR